MFLSLTVLFPSPTWLSFNMRDPSVYDKAHLVAALDAGFREQQSCWFLKSNLSLSRAFSLGLLETTTSPVIGPRNGSSSISPDS
jgi:hypothetical protein